MRLRNSSNPPPAHCGTCGEHEVDSVETSGKMLLAQQRRPANATNVFEFCNHLSTLNYNIFRLN